MTRDAEALAWRAGGWPLSNWLELWEACHVSGFNGPMRAAWPDGKSALDQPAITVAVFDLIGDAVAKHMESERGKQHG